MNKGIYPDRVSITGNLTEWKPILQAVVIHVINADIVRNPESLDIFFDS